MSSLADLENEKRSYQENLELLLASLADNPDNEESQALKVEVEELIEMTDGLIAEAKAKLKKAATAPAPADGGNKWSRENHPALKDAGDSTPITNSAGPETTVIQYNVNDSVMAKWMSGDKGFYPARITSITGSSMDPVYTVKFKGYDDTVETLRLKDIRPVGGPATSAAGTKRKADDQATPGSGLPVPPVTANNGLGATTAAPKAAEAERDPNKPKNIQKKIKPNKELEAGKNKWQEFNAKKFKSGGLSGATKKKDSMFRTPEGVHGRVGFISSGKTKAKEVTRTRNVYEIQKED